jgi:CHASE3 domain sensor protein
MRSRMSPSARGAALVLLPALLGGCQKSKDEPKNLGEQMADVTVDTQVMRDAQAAVNEVIRASSDCELAKPAIAAANMKLDEAARHVRTAAGNATLDALRKQVRNVQDACP